MRKSTIILTALLTAALAANAHAAAKKPAKEAKPAAKAEASGPSEAAKMRFTLGLAGLFVPGAMLVLLNTPENPYRADAAPAAKKK